MQRKPGCEVPGTPFLVLMNLKVPYCLVRNALMRWKAPPLRRDCNRSKRFFLAWLAASNGWERTTWRDGRGEERRSLRDKEVKCHYIRYCSRFPRLLFELTLYLTTFLSSDNLNRHCWSCSILRLSLVHRFAAAATVAPSVSYHPCSRHPWLGL